MMKKQNDRSLDNRELNTEDFQPQNDDGTIICRCEEISKGEIRRAIHDGMYTMTEIKRYLRAGMGLCQGQTCGRLVRGILARELGVNPLELDLPVSRPPVRPTGMEVMANEVISRGGEG